METLLWILGALVLLLFLAIALAIENENKWKGPPELEGVNTFPDDY